MKIDSIMNDFEFYLPVRIIYGAGKFTQLNDVIDDLYANVLLVCDKIISEKTSILKRLQSSLRSGNTYLFDEIEQNPSFDTVERAALFAIEKEIDLVIGVGGGSCMDAAKGIAIRAASKHSIRSIVMDGIQINKALPVYCIPTTAGTGSEVTPFAVFSDHQNRSKEGYGNDLIFPKLSIIDPELTYTLPADIILNTGLDVLAHSVEAFLSETSSDISDTIAIRAIELVRDNLSLAVKKEKPAMGNMSYASMLAGIAITHSSTILPHIMGYPLTVYHKIPHGRASIIPLPSFLSYLQENKLAVSKVTRLGDIFADYKGIKGFLNYLGVSVKLKDYGIEESELPVYVKKTIGKGDVKITPGSITEELIQNIYQDML